MNRLVTGICFAFVIVYSLTGYAQKKEYRVLFVGNSLTYSNDLTSTIRINQNTGERPTVKTKWSNGREFDARVLAGAATKTPGDVTKNHITLITNTSLINSTNNKIVGRPIDLLGIPTIQQQGRSLAHELGHTLGLYHPWETEEDGADKYDIRNEDGLGPVGKPEIVKFNLMNSEGNPIKWLQSTQGTTITDNQRKKIDKKLEEVKEPSKK